MFFNSILSKIWQDIDYLNIFMYIMNKFTLPEEINEKWNKIIEIIKQAIKDNIPIKFKHRFNEKVYSLKGINFNKMRADVFNENSVPQHIVISCYDLFEMAENAEKEREKIKKRTKKTKVQKIGLSETINPIKSANTDSLLKDGNNLLAQLRNIKANGLHK